VGLGWKQLRHWRRSQPSIEGGHSRVTTKWQMDPWLGVALGSRWRHGWGWLVPLPLLEARSYFLLIIHKKKNTCAFAYNQQREGCSCSHLYFPWLCVTLQSMKGSEIRMWYVIRKLYVTGFTYWFSTSSRSLIWSSGLLFESHTSICEDANLISRRT
jgi:hypothetical protein